MANRKVVEPFRLIVPEGLSYAYIGIPVKPKAKARGRIGTGQKGKKYIYKTAEDRRWGDIVRKYIFAQAAPINMLDDKDGLTMITIFEIANKQKYKWGEPAVARPDLSNYIKNIEDELNDFVYKDDAGIFQIYSLKIYNDRDFVNIILVPGKEYLPILGSVLNQSGTLLAMLQNKED